MEDWYIPPTPRYSVREVKTFSKREKIMAGMIAALILIIVSTLSFFIGRESTTPQFLSTVQEPPETQTPSPSFSLSPAATISGTVTPTKKLTGSPAPTLPAQTKILSSVVSLDGFRSSNGSGNETLEIRSGRNNNLVSRGFVSFDISVLANDAKVQEAKLRLYQAKVIGNPISLLGALKIDHLTYGDSLDKSDYGASALSSSFATLTTNTKIEWKEVDVTDAVKNDVSNARSLSQFRIHFQTETTGGDEIGDFVYFEASENNLKTGNTPQLVVKYY